MDPVTIMTALSVASTLTSTVANFKKAESDRDALLNKQALRTLEANEMRRRFSFNQDLLSKKLNDQNQDFLGRFGQTAAGAAGSETGYMVRSSLMENMTKELERSKIEADFEINARLREADAYGAEAANVNRMTPITLLAGGVSGAKDLYSIYK